LRIEAPEIWSEFQLVTEFGQCTHFYTGYAYSDIEYVVHRNNRQIAFLHLGADFLVRDIYVKPRGIIWLPLRDFSPLIGPTQLTDFAGPLCFAGDFLEKGVSMPAFQEGDGLLLLGTGSNAYALWSRHTSRTIPALYGVDFQLRKIGLFSGRTNPFI
jgi:diaminopimelate decarboxylase